MPCRNRFLNPQQTRQALGLGARDFHPTSLEAEYRVVHEANLFGAQLHSLERSLAKWGTATDGEGDVQDGEGRVGRHGHRPLGPPPPAFPISTS